MKATAKQYYIDLTRLTVSKKKILVHLTSTNKVTVVRSNGFVKTLIRSGVVYPVFKGQVLDVEFLEER